MPESKGPAVGERCGLKSLSNYDVDKRSLYASTRTAARKYGSSRWNIRQGPLQREIAGCGMQKFKINPILTRWRNARWRYRQVPRTERGVVAWACRWVGEARRKWSKLMRSRRKLGGNRYVEHSPWLSRNYTKVHGKRSISQARKKSYGVSPMMRGHSMDTMEDKCMGLTAPGIGLLERKKHDSIPTTTRHHPLVLPQEQGSADYFGGKNPYIRQVHVSNSEHQNKKAAARTRRKRTTMRQSIVKQWPGGLALDVFKEAAQNNCSVSFVWLIRGHMSLNNGVMTTWRTAWPVVAEHAINTELGKWDNSTAHFAMEMTILYCQV